VPRFTGLGGSRSPSPEERSDEGRGRDKLTVIFYYDYGKKYY